jgi:formate dehydrogenase major subunit
MTGLHPTEHMVNNVTGQGCDGDTMCPEYKIVAADVERVRTKGKLAVMAI